MKHVITGFALASVVAFSGASFANAKKESWHCVDAAGKEVAGVKEKKACTAPNKWEKATAAADHADHAAPAAAAPAEAAPKK